LKQPVFIPPEPRLGFRDAMLDGQAMQTPELFLGYFLRQNNLLISDAKTLPV
jgi:hypothetical protein